MTIVGAPTSLVLGQTAQLTASVSVTGGASQGISWSSDKPNIISVTNTNPATITGLAVGTAAITAKSQADPGKAATVTLTVTTGVRSVTISPTVATLTAGDRLTLAATVNADAGVTDRTVRWRSNDATVASVSTAGLLTGLRAGTTTVTAQANADTTISAAVAVTVKPPAQAATTWASSRVAAIPGPMTGGVAALWGTSATNMYAVTDGGEIARFDGSRWQVVFQSTASFSGVFGNSSTDIFAVGGSAPWHSGDGSTWTTQSAPGTASLRAVWSAGPALAFAVGDGGTILRYNGSTWSAMQSPTTQDLLAVSGVNASEAWAVGRNGTLLRYNGATWSAIASGTAQTLNAVWSIAANDAHAAGTGGTLLRCRMIGGSATFTCSSFATGTTSSILAIHGVTALEAFAVGANGTLFQWNGVTWGTSTAQGGLPLPFAGTVNFRDSVRAVWDAGVATAGVFIGGADGMTGVYHPPGTPAAGTTILSVLPSYYAVGGTGSRLFAAGGYGTIVQFDAGSTSTTFVTSPTSASLRGISLPFIVGAGGTVLRLNNGVWSPMASPTTVDLSAVSAISTTDAIAVSDINGTILKLTGSTWAPMASPTSSPLWGVCYRPDGTAIAVGRSTALRYDGAKWTQMAAPAVDLTAIWCFVDPANPLVAGAAYAVSVFGSIWMNAPGSNTWTDMHSSVTVPLFGIWGASSTDAYAVGHRGTILHFDGISWGAMTSNAATSVAFNAVAGFDGGGVIAAGIPSTVGRGSPGSNGASMVVRRIHKP